MIGKRVSPDVADWRKQAIVMTARSTPQRQQQRYYCTGLHWKRSVVGAEPPAELEIEMSVEWI